MVFVPLGGRAMTGKPLVLSHLLRKAPALAVDRIAISDSPADAVTAIKDDAMGAVPTPQLRSERAASHARPSMASRFLGSPPWHRDCSVMAKLERLDDLLRAEPSRARVEIARHLDGDLTLVPVLSENSSHAQAA